MNDSRCKGCPVMVNYDEDYCWILNDPPIECPCWKCIVMPLCSEPCEEWEDAKRENNM